MVKAKAELIQMAAADAAAEVGFMDTTEEQAETMVETAVQAVSVQAEAQGLGLFLRVAQVRAAAMVMPHYFTKRRKTYGIIRKSHKSLL
jgi:hypothetical protein